MEEVDRMLYELEEAMHHGWSPDGSLRPLYTVYEHPDRYTILVDLAAADTSSLEVRVVDDRLVIEAKLEREIRFSDVYGTPLGREVKFRLYRHEMMLPPDADPSGMHVRIKPNKIVEIVIPKKQG
jgi:HSP20 family protein